MLGKTKTAWFLGLTFAFFSFRLVHFVYANGVNLFYYDQWDAYTGLFTGENSLRLFFWQQGPHRMGVGIWLTRFLLGISHWNERVEEYGVALILMVSAGLALSIKRRITGAFEAWDALLIARFLSLAGWESLVGTPVPSIGTIPCLLILFTAWLLCRRADRWTAVWLVGLQFALVFTGHGYVASPFLLFYLFARTARSTGADRMRWAASFLLAVVPLVLFYLTQQPGHEGTACFGESLSLKSYGIFSGAYAICLAGLYPYVPFLPYVGVGILLGLLTWFTRSGLGVWRRPDDSFANATFLLLGSSVLFGLLASYGRACLGVRGAYTSRYYEFMLLGFLAGYLYLIRISDRARRTVALSALLLLTFVLEAFIQVHQLPKVRHELQVRARVKDCLVQGESVARCQREFDYVIHPNLESGRVVSKVEALRTQRRGPFWTPTSSP